MKASKQLIFSSAAIAATALLSICMSRSDTALAAKVNAKSSQLDAAVRQLVEERCGRCHNSTRETAKPAALKVFDLNKDNWTASMADRQLPIVLDRLKSVNVAPEKLGQVEEFINGKLEERGALKHQ
jgi:hypothetical protein